MSADKPQKFIHKNNFVWNADQMAWVPMEQPEVVDFSASAVITNPQDGDILVYNAGLGKWVNQQP